MLPRHLLPTWAAMRAPLSNPARTRYALNHGGLFILAVARRCGSNLEHGSTKCSLALTAPRPPGRCNGDPGAFTLPSAGRGPPRPLLRFPAPPSEAVQRYCSAADHAGPAQPPAKPGRQLPPCNKEPARNPPLHIPRQPPGLSWAARPPSKPSHPSAYLRARLLGLTAAHRRAPRSARPEQRATWPRCPAPSHRCAAAAAPSACSSTASPRALRIIMWGVSQ
jgi:hypothetical protein